jgi:uncharacterized protein (TIGR00369 family)
MTARQHHLSVLEYLTRHTSETLEAHHTTHLRYPTAISRTLGMRIVAVGHATATLEIDADPGIHGNQQGTVHGGLLSELADATIGTAHSTLIEPGESLTSIELKVNFFRPVWRTTLRATARPTHQGRNISHYTCEILRDDGKLAALATSTIMTLRGEQAVGR